jgi:hypothetical protein
MVLEACLCCVRPSRRLLSGATSPGVDDDAKRPCAAVVSSARKRKRQAQGYTKPANGTPWALRLGRRARAGHYTCTLYSVGTACVHPQTVPFVGQQ